MRKSNFICIVSECGEKAVCRQLCPAHYRRWKRHKDPLAGRTSRGAKECFLVSSIGHTGDECLLSPFQTDENRNYWSFSKNKKQVNAHRWMCEAVNGPPPSPSHMAAHECGKGHLGCVNPKHLRWATPSENAMDKYRHGTAQVGEKCSKSKLNESDVLKIRRMFGRASSTDIAKRFGVTKKTILLIGHRRTWAHV